MLSTKRWCQQDYRQNEEQITYKSTISCSQRSSPFSKTYSNNNILPKIISTHYKRQTISYSSRPHVQTTLNCSVQLYKEQMLLLSRQRPYHVENTGSRPITEVKQRRARLVLGWVTAWEHRVLLANIFLFIVLHAFNFSRFSALPAQFLFIIFKEQQTSPCSFCFLYVCSVFFPSLCYEIIKI